MCLFYGKHKLNHSYYFFSCKYALPAQNACSLTENHRDFRSNKKRHLKARLLSVSFYGDEGNRTPVRKNLAKGFSERSWCFKSPSVHRPSTGYALWQLLSCDRVRSAPLFTFTSNRRPLHSRGTLCRNEQHSGC